MSEVTYQQERYSTVIREALPLLYRHWQEVGAVEKIPYDPNFDYYYMQERAGNIALVTARSNGVLVGYCMQVCGYGIHYKQTAWGVNDVVYVDPAYRSGWIWVKLLIKMEEVLRSMKVQVFEMLPRDKHPALGRICDYLGFDRIGTIHQKWIGD